MCRACFKHTQFNQFNLHTFFNLNINLKTKMKLMGNHTWDTFTANLDKKIKRVKQSHFLGPFPSRFLIRFAHFAATSCSAPEVDRSLPEHSLASAQAEGRADHEEVDDGEVLEF